MEDMVRAHVIIAGRVQGVFFRLETQRAAERYGVSGWVRNKRDGTVEAVFEGDQTRVDSILKWCQQGSPAAAVERVDLTWEEHTGEYPGFEITY
ncbi:MAG: acylphosphatase [Deltaproteobacteria bacterium]|nr:MAG: acylphosphatase [Deltaproteobacteria bacterium]